MRNNATHFPTGILLALALTACATGPQLSREQVLNRHQEIARLQSELEAARSRGAADLAPEGFQAAQQDFDEAMDAATAGRNEAAEAAAREGLARLEEVERDVALSNDLLREVLDRRERSVQAGAPNLYPGETAELERELREASHLIEQGQLEDAKERRATLITDYEQLELRSLKKGTVAIAEAAIRNAREKDAPDYAPKTFGEALEELELATGVLEADRTDVDRAEAHARQARWLAERSIGLTELIKDFERRDYSQEDVVLWYQDQLSAVARPLDRQLPFDEPNREVVSTLENAMQRLIAERDATSEARSRYEQELAREVGAKHTVEQVQAMFAAFEAKVYQQQEDVLISAHGLQFPPGGSELGTESYGLLKKISTAIEAYPDSTIRLTGHTDSTGSPEANLRLSERRAETVARFLTEAGGIAPQRIVTEGYGEARPVASNETASGRAANRRVEILIDAPKQMP